MTEQEAYGQAFENGRKVGDAEGYARGKAEALEVPDKALLKAIKLLLRQYEHSKNSDYVHSPVAHAFYHTWRQLDERREK